MIAKYPGRCAECGGRIEPGDEVERSRETNPTDLTGHGQLCGQCFTYHRGECA